MIKFAKNLPFFTEICQLANFKKKSNYGPFSTWHACMSNEALLWNLNISWHGCLCLFFYWFFFSNLHADFNRHVFDFFLNHENMLRFARNILKFDRNVQFAEVEKFAILL